MASVSVSFEPPVNTGNDPPIVNYVVVAMPGNFTNSGTSSPITVSGLSYGVPYTFTVTAYNAAGGSYPSTPVALTLTAVPGAPLALSAVGGEGLATVSFTAPYDNGSPIIQYTMQSTPGGFTAVGTGSPITVTGLTDGTSYTFSATATNANGTGPASGPSNAIIPGNPPSAPTIGTAVAYNGYATVAFTPGATGGLPNLQYVAVSTPGGFIGTGISSPVTINGLTNGVTYTFDVVAVNALGTSPPSTQSNAVTPGLPATVPGQPTSVAAVGGNAQAIVTFTAPSSGGSAITGYTVTASPGGATGSGSASPITVTGLTNGTAYTFTVTATNGVGTGSPSTPSNSVTPSTVPGAPTGVSATAGILSASVAFTAPSTIGGSPISQYTATSSPGGFTGTSNASPVLVAGLTKEVAYTFTVTATNGVGTGAASSPSSAVTPYGVPAAPTGVTAASGNGQVLVTFTAPDNGGSAITGYTATAAPGGATASGSASPITITGLTNGTPYTVTVTATNAAGTGPASASAPVTPSGVPLAPTSVNAVSGTTPSTGAITISGHRLVDSSGNTWVGHGANFSGLETAGPQGYQPWYGKTVPWSTYATDNPSIVRIPLCAATILQLNCCTINAAGNGWVSTTPVNADPFGNTLAALDAAIVNAQALGCAVILDLHWSAPSFTFAGVTAYAMPEFQPPFANAITDLLFWKFIAGRYGTQASPQPGINNNRILFELFNEPYLDQYETGAPLYALMKNGGTLSSFKTNGVTTPVAQAWTVLGYQQMLNAIRALGANNICIVNGPGYSSSCSGIASYAPADTLNPPQIAGGLHPYGNAASWAAEATNYYPAINYDTGSTGVNWWQSTQAAITAGYPMLFTECGDFYGEDNSGTAPCLNQVCIQAAALGVSAVVVWEYFQARAGDPGTPASGQYVSLTSSNTPTENQGVYLQTYLQSFVAGTPFATVSFTAPNNEGSPILSYTATSSPGGFTATGPTSPLTVTGLTINTTYTFSVTATNINGTGPAGVSNSVTIGITAPTPPLSPVGTSGNASVSVAFTAPASNGGASISQYTVTSSPGGLVGTGITSPIVVSGLTNGTPYTFTVTATNSAGTSAPSASTTAVTPSTVPSAPTGLVGTAGNGQVSVAFVAPNNGGSAITQYTITANPGGATASGTASPIVVTGLTNGQPYTFTATATNVNGPSAPSNASNPVTPITVPGAPTNVVGTPGNASVSVAFTAPVSNGGATISGYTATAAPGGAQASGAGSPLNVTGLTNNQAYTFRVTATNAAGTGPASAASLSVTPTAPQGFVITTTTEPNGSLGVAYSGQVTAAGSAFTPYTYANTTALPPGLVLNQNTGAITGTPTAGGQFTTGFQATDSSGGFTVPVATIVANNDGIGNGNVPSDSITASTTVPLVANGLVIAFGTVATYNASHNARTCTSAAGTFNLTESVQGPNSTQNPNAINASQETDMSVCTNPSSGNTSFTWYWGNVGDTDFLASWFCQHPAGTTLIGHNSAAQTGTQWVGVNQNTKLYSGYIPVTAAQVPCRLYGLCTNTSQIGSNWLPTPGQVIEQTSGTVVGTMSTFANIWNFANPAAGYTTCVAFIDITQPGNYQASFINPSAGIAGKTGNCFQTFGWIVQGPGGANAVTPVKTLSFSIAGASVPGIPTGVSAAPGNANSLVYFTPPTSSGGSPITGYTAVASPGNIATSGTTSPILATGLTNGVSYTFTIYATNANGNGLPSVSTNAVVPKGVPGPVSNVQATPGNGQATVTYNAPTIVGGSAITGYSATASPGGAIATIFSPTPAPITVTGLTNGQTYTISVIAFNNIGTGVPPVNSGPVMPVAPSGSRKANILAYFAGLPNGTSKRVLSGQHTDIFNTNQGNNNSQTIAMAMDQITPLPGLTGKQVAVQVWVMNYVGPLAGATPISTMEQGVANAWGNNSFVVCTLYSGVPITNTGPCIDHGQDPNVTGPVTSTQFTSIVSGAFNANWIAQCNLYAAECAKLVKNGNVILWKPFIEINGGQNWYSNQNAAQFISLWKQMWNVFQATSVNGQPLNNFLIWMYNVNQDQGSYTSFFPGSAYCDMTSGDAYSQVSWPNSGPYPAATLAQFEIKVATFYAGLTGLGLPLWLGECGLATNTYQNQYSNPNNNTQDNTQYINAIRSQAPGITGFLAFSGGWAISAQNNASALMNDPWVISLSDLPAGLNNGNVPSVFAQLISRSVPAYASTGTAAQANDSNYNTAWNSNGSTGTLAYDLSGVASSLRQQISLSWYNDNTYEYDHSQYGGAQLGYNNLGSYTVEVNSAAGGGAAPTTGWVTATPVAGTASSTVVNNTCHSLMHTIQFAGYNWVRLNISASDGTTGNFNLQCNMDVFSATGTVGGWAIMGDSITANCMGHTNFNTVNCDSFTNLVGGGSLGAVYPAQECWGQSGWKTSDWVGYVGTALPRFSGQYIGIALGSNDANSAAGVSPTTFYNNMVTLVNAVIAAGKTPVVATIPWSANSSYEPQIPALNAKIQALYAAYPTTVLKGPDLFTYFQNNPSQIGPDGIHPTDQGGAALRNLWANIAIPLYP